MEYRYAADGTKQFLRVLLLLTDHPEADVRGAVARCVARRAFNADAIENALRNAPLDVPSSRLDLSDHPELAHVGNGIRLAADYDRIVAAQRESRIEEPLKTPSHDREGVIFATEAPTDDHSLTVAAPCRSDESHGDESHAVHEVFCAEGPRSVLCPVLEPPQEDAA